MLPQIMALVAALCDPGAIQKSKPCSVESFKKCHSAMVARKSEPHRNRKGGVDQKIRMKLERESYQSCREELLGKKKAK